MRPSALDRLFAPLTTLPGIGPRLASQFDRLLAEPGQGARVIDLLFHAPVGVIDRRHRPKIVEARPGEIATIEARVVSHQPPRSHAARAPYRILVEDDTGDLTLAYFHGARQQLEKLLPPGERRIISGRVELWDGLRQMVHPDLVVAPDRLDPAQLVQPVYPLTEGLSGRIVAKAVSEALARLPDLPEWLADPAGLPGFALALTDLHHPDSEAALEPAAPARRRLARDEMLATQLALALDRRHRRRGGGRPQAGDGHLRRAIAATLPFSLTPSQEQALAEIEKDLAAPERMSRLLQGDVGSGKTVVGLMAMAAVAETGRQAVLMAPTDLLARQHYERIAPLAAAAGLDVALLTGSDRAAERRKRLEGLASGRIALAVGTHALFQQGVAFRDLGLAVIDEQHRFGVHQRLSLGTKGAAVDLLVMTATPIPRTLALTYFGDMDVSVLSDKPAGRQPIDTRTIPLDRLDEVVAAVQRAVRAGKKIYWVCPLVAESETLDVAAAEERFETLRQVLGPVVELLHGRMAGRDKDAAMARFAQGDAAVLVATTVIEVGIDVPAATIMVIEHAERFGLAQLHQLRGRIGRGSEASTCLLLYKPPLGTVAEARLKVMRETEDGFRIAEEDLRLRGHGDIMGTRQSGMPDFRFADPQTAGPLLEAARREAQYILDRNPALSGSSGEALRMLLYLFGRDEAIRLMRAG